MDERANPWAKVLSRWSSLVGRVQLTNWSAISKTSPKKTWTLQSQESLISHHVSIGTSPTMEDSWHISCRPADPLLRNKVPRTQLYETTSWPYRWRRGIWNWGDPAIKEVWERAQGTIPHQVEGVPRLREPMGRLEQLACRRSPGCHDAQPVAGIRG